MNCHIALLESMPLEHEAKLVATERHVAAREFFYGERFAFHFVDAVGAQSVNIFHFGVACRTIESVELLYGERGALILEMADVAQALASTLPWGEEFEHRALHEPVELLIAQVERATRREGVDLHEMPTAVEFPVFRMFYLHQSARGEQRHST